MMKFVMHDEPRPKARHRTRIIGNKIISYDPQRSEKLKKKWYFGQEMRRNGFKSIQVAPISVTVTNYTPMPKSWSLKRLNASEGKPCLTRPDIDNYVKNYLDILNGIAYEDDKQVTELHAYKFYSKEPRVEIEIKEVCNDC